MDFGEAIHALKGGKRVSRAGWNGKGMYLYLVRNGSCPDEHGLRQPLAPFIAMKPVSGPEGSWLASQTDVLAEDWVILEEGGQQWLTS